MDQNDQPTSQNKYPDDMKTLNDIGSDDIVICTNIFDTDMVFDYNSQPHRWRAGQTTTLLGYKARLFLKKLAQYGHLHHGDPDPKDTGINIKDNYELSDRFLAKAIKQITRGMQPEVVDTKEEVQMPEYVSQDENLAKHIGEGAHEIAPVVIDPTDVATEESEAKYDAPQYNITPETIDKADASDAGGDEGGQDMPDAPGTAGSDEPVEQPFPSVTQTQNR